MKQAIKKVTSLLLTVVMALSVIPFAEIKADAASTGEKYSSNPTIAERIDTVISNYGPGDFFTKNGKACSCHNKSVDCIAAGSDCNCLRKPTINGKKVDLYGSQCLGYSRYWQQVLFGANEYSSSKFKELSGVSKSLTSTNLKDWFTANKAQLHPGTHLRVLSSSHSVVLLGVDYSAGKITYIECNWSDQKVNNGIWCKISSIQTDTWSKFASTYGTLDFAYVYKNYYSEYPDKTSNELTITYSANGGTIGSFNEYVVSTDGSTLTLRASASTSSSVLDSIPDGQTLTVTETKSAGGYTWGKTTYNGQTGWCALDYTVRQGFYLNSDMVYRYSNSSAVKAVWDYGEGSSSGLYNASTFKLTRNGYTFEGWSLNANGSGTIFDQDDATLKAEDICPDVANGDKSVVLYAVWTPQFSHTFKFDGNGGTGTVEPIYRKNNETLELPQNAFTRDGYKFIGWYVNRENDNTWHVSGVGWLTEEQILSNGYEKHLYETGDFKLDYSWFSNPSVEGACSYTFYAVWQSDLVESIGISEIEQKEVYYVNEQIDTSKIVLNVNKKDGTSEKITSGFTCSPVTLQNEGKQTITVTYEHKQTTFDVLVTANKSTNITAKATENNVCYYLPDSDAIFFNPGAYNGDTCIILCQEGDYYLGFFPYGASSATKANGFLGYMLKSSFATPSANVPQSTVYYSMNPTGKNNATAKVEAKVYHRPATTAISGSGDKDYTSYETLAANQQIRVLFALDNFYCVRTNNSVGFVEKSAIKLNKIVTGITATTAQASIEQNGQIDESKISVYAKYSDGTTTKLSLQDVEITKPDTSVLGEKAIVIAYSGYQTSISVTISEKVVSDTTTRVSNVATTPSDIGVTLSWDAFEGAVRYYAKVYDKDFTKCLKTISVEGTSAFFDYKILSYNTDYKFIVTAELSSGKYLQVADATKVDGAMVIGDRVVGHTITMEGKGAIVDFLPVENATEYLVNVFENDANGTRIYTATLDKNTTTARIMNNLIAGTKYVVMINAKVNGNYMPLADLRVNGIGISFIAPVYNPSSVTIAAETATSVRFNWDAVRGATQYFIKVTEKETGNLVNTLKAVGKTTATLSRYTDGTRISPNTTYVLQFFTYVNSATNSGVYGDPIEITTIGYEDVSIAAKENGNKVDLFWNSTTNAVGYFIYTYKNGVKVSNKYVDGGATTTYSVKAPTAAGTYTYGVIAYEKNSSGTAYTPVSISNEIVK